MARRKTEDAPGIIARENAIKVLNQILSSRRSLEEVINLNSSYQQMEPRDRAFVRLLVATTLRRLGQIDALVRSYLKRPLPKKAQAVRDILRIGVAQIVLLETPTHAVVDTSVRLCGKTRNPGQKGLVNAVLRKISLDGNEKFYSLDSALLNTPKWLWNNWQKTYGEKLCRAIAKAHLQLPPLNLTVKSDPGRWAKILNAELLPTGSLSFKPNGKVESLPGYDDGNWWVQDTAAALPARILLAATKHKKRLRILDLCAAPGGKTAQLASSGALVTAVDQSNKRLKVLRENLGRLNLTATVITADAENFSPPNSIDGILLDAPCSATGTIRRHPEILRIKTPDDVSRLFKKQAGLLSNAVDQLLPGGILVYSVCSLLSEEGVDVIEGILEKRDNIKRLVIDPKHFGLPQSLQTKDGDIQSLPCYLEEHGGMDGFFISCLHLPN